MAAQKAITRPMDELGRIVIPIDIREAFGWNHGTKLEIAISETYADAIEIKQAFPCCTLCRKGCENLLRIEAGYICPQCSAKIK